MTDGAWLGDVPAAVEITAGTTGRWSIGSAAGAGYRWEIVRLDGATDTDVAVEAGEIPAASATTSAAAPLTLAVNGRCAGESHWQLRLVRPFAPDTPLVTHRLTVRVVPRRQ